MRLSSIPYHTCCHLRSSRCEDSPPDEPTVLSQADWKKLVLIQFVLLLTKVTQFWDIGPPRIGKSQNRFGFGHQFHVRQITTSSKCCLLYEYWQERMMMKLKFKQWALNQIKALVPLTMIWCSPRVSGSQHCTLCISLIAGLLSSNLGNNIATSAWELKSRGQNHHSNN